MRHLILFALTIVSAISVAQTPVSGYDLKGTLDPYVNNNPPNVQPLEHRTGANPTQPYGPTNYTTTTVGTTNKGVVEFQAPQFFRALHGMSGNGGGAGYVNLYTIVMDVKFDNPVIGSFASLFNTNFDCANDGDSFVRWDDNGVGVPTGRLGISGTYAGDLSPNEWHRIAISVDCTANAGVNTTLTYYVDGVQVNQVSGSAGLDGRWAAYSWNDNDTDGDNIDILGDEDGDNGTGELSLLVFYDSILNPADVLALGPVGSAVGGNSPVTLAPTSFVVGLGNTISGNVASLAADDSDVLKLCKGFVPNFAAPRMRMDATYLSPYLTATSLQLDMTARMTTGGAFKIRGFLADTSGSGTFAYGVANQVIADTAIALAFANYSSGAVATGTHIDTDADATTDGTIVARTEIQQTGFSAVPVPCSEWELMTVTVTP